MEIRRKDMIDRFISKHPDSRNALQRWLEIAEKAEWKNHAEIKVDFPSVDYVGNGRYVFNIRGNNYRLVTVTVFVSGLLSVRFVGTHDEYNRIDCETV